MTAAAAKQAASQEGRRITSSRTRSVAGHALPGCKIESLLFDPKSGIATMLFKMELGAEIPDHEHVLIEQTYVLEGSLVDKEGPDTGIAVKAGEFVWRDPGSRHTAWSPNGGTFVAMFQIPNKFFEKDGRVLDPTGKDWDSVWAALLPK